MSDITRDYSFGGWLRNFRIEKEIGLREYAEQIEMQPGNLSKLERSELDPPCSFKSVERLVKPLKPESVEFMASLAFSFHVGKLKQKFKGDS
jgi:hypothetical protein